MSKGGSVYDQSASAFGQAGGLYGNAAKLLGQPGMYKPALAGTPQAAAPGAIHAGMDPYMSKYTGTVIDRGMADIERQRALQQQQIGANAASVGAFGGSRQGIVEALNNSEAQKNTGDLSATLMDQAFRTAGQFAGQDVANTMNNNQFNTGLAGNIGLANAAAKNQASQFGADNLLSRAAGLGTLGGAVQGLGSTGFDIGQAITGQQMQQGTMQQQLIQAIMGGAGGQYNQFMGRPQDALMLRLQSLGMNPINNETTTTGSYTPGLMDWASLAAGMYGANQMGKSA